MVLNAAPQATGGDDALAAHVTSIDGHMRKRFR
jgi:hypothetical protein